jgi:putative intracellular protease/amidase
VFVDRHWTEWLPICAWVVEHPEGVIVVDTGETARAPYVQVDGKLVTGQNPASSGPAAKEPLRLLRLV